MSIGQTAIRRWIGQHLGHTLPIVHPPLTAEQLRIRELEKENSQLR